MKERSFAAELASENVVAFPTETVYGLGANACSDKAVKQVFALKGRPSDNPLIVHVATIAAVSALSGSEPPPEAHNLMNKFWPGPLAIILPLSDSSPLSKFVTAGLTTAAFRMPSHPDALALLRDAAALGVQGVAAPSANKSGRPSPTSAAHVKEDFAGEELAIMETAVPCEVGLESTVLDLSCSPPVILRHGAVTASAIRAETGIEVDNGERKKGEEGDRPKAPGMKYRHYAPKAKVILCEDWSTLPAEARADGARVLAFEGTEHGFGPEQILSLGGGVKEGSQRLFEHLRTCDQLGATMITVDVGPVLAAGEEGLAMLDRLRKAASG
eukprot:CAMPEP_0177722950 /NCGR_PEP_ID=MMETSP0484_2-20121128/17952_1 /TAXON_ID=354590 /ORGANISM="Rhodomonas lens, Strain RHODO" /LENGTH=328 /DNA_ID=CAMNT_0019235353 /DNA_START=218 /DNA_END=1204 /DNA_ORIENTATION=+